MVFFLYLPIFDGEGDRAAAAAGWWGFLLRLQLIQHQPVALMRHFP